MYVKYICVFIYNCPHIEKHVCENIIHVINIHNEYAYPTLRYFTRGCESSVYDVGTQFPCSTKIKQDYIFHIN